MELIQIDECSAECLLIVLRMHLINTTLSLPATRISYYSEVVFSRVRFVPRTGGEWNFGERSGGVAARPTTRGTQVGAVREQWISAIPVRDGHTLPLLIAPRR